MIVQLDEESPEEIKKKDATRTGAIIREKVWLKRERQKAVEKLPNELRHLVAENYNDFGYTGDYYSVFD